MKLTFTATQCEKGIEVNGTVEEVTTDGELLLLVAAIGMKCENLIAEAKQSLVDLPDEEAIFVHHHPDNDLSIPYLQAIVDAAIRRLKGDE